MPKAAERFEVPVPKDAATIACKAALRGWMILPAGDAALRAKEPPQDAGSMILVGPGPSVRVGIWIESAGPTSTVIVLEGSTRLGGGGPKRVASVLAGLRNEIEVEAHRG